MSAKGMKIEISRQAFTALYEYLKRDRDTATFRDHSRPPSSARDDFLERNAKKYEKEGKVRDEVIQFPRYTVVHLKTPISYGGNAEYVVVRARKRPNGSREYWISALWNITPLGPAYVGRTRIHISKKVSADSIRKARDCTPEEKRMIEGYRLPREM